MSMSIRYIRGLRKEDSMVKILLACSAGMSTSLLVNKMQAYAASKNIDASIEARISPNWLMNLPV